MAKRRLITFDWAMKRLLRSKANFDILEGFLSELLKDNITILDLLESESNKDTEQNKLNQVDLKVKNGRGEIIIIEVQYTREYDYLQRILLGVSKVITEHLDKSAQYNEVVKVISVNILYFDLGQGDDYVYHGTTRFVGLHNDDELQLSRNQKEILKKETVSDIYPEYYLLKINQFNDIAKDSLDEWIYFLKNEEIKDEFNAKGLKKAKEEFDVLKLTQNERHAYESHVAKLRSQASLYYSSQFEGHAEGHAEGVKEGIKKEKIQTAKKLLLKGFDIETIAELTELTSQEITKL